MLVVMTVVLLVTTIGCDSVPVGPRDLPPASPTMRPTTEMSATVQLTKRPLFSDDKESAVAIIQASGVVESINGGQEWEAGRITHTHLAGTLGVAVEVKWREPVESSGPWMEVHCKGTRVSEISESWSQITQLEVIVGIIYPASVVGYTVVEGEEEVAAVRNPGETPSPPTIREVETGEILWKSISGRKFPTEEELCPPDTVDRDARRFN